MTDYLRYYPRNPNLIANYSTVSASVSPGVNLSRAPRQDCALLMDSIILCFEAATDWACTGQVCRLCHSVIAAPIFILPENILLEIFGIYVDSAAWPHEDAWHTLVHVCRRWRYIVFVSHRCLKLQLRCTNKRSAQMMLDIWPALPIAVEFRSGMLQSQVASNIITALNQRDRIRKIDLYPIPLSLLRKIGSIKRPLPVLTDLKLALNNEEELSLPDSFLGGSAPRLRSLQLIGIPFPALSNLLSSTAELVTLYISSIPHSSHTSPETMVTSLSTLTKLQSLTLGFQSSQSPADNAGRFLPLQTRIVLPALTSLYLLSYDEYLEDIVSRIDIPLLEDMTTEPFKQRVFDPRQLRDFISHMKAFKPFHRADIDMIDSSVSLIIFSRGAVADHEYELLKFTTSRKPLDWPVLRSFAQFCISALPPLPTLTRLDIRKSGQHWQNRISDPQWIDLLRPFTSVKDLILSETAAGHVAPALRGLAVENETDILPALQNLFLKASAQSGPTQEAISQFVDTRRLSNRPVSVFYEG